MKGVIFNVVQEVVEDLYDTETWDTLLDSAEVDGAYTALGDYANAELVAIVAATSSATGLGAEDVLRLVGYHALPKLAERVPSSLTNAEDPLTFIRRVNDIIHPEVLKIYPDSIPPAFAFDDHPDGLLVTYQSHRGLPALAEGLLSGVSHLFEADVNVESVDGFEGEGSQFLVTLADQ